MLLVARHGANYNSEGTTVLIGGGPPLRLILIWQLSAPISVFTSLDLNNSIIYEA